MSRGRGMLRDPVCGRRITRNGAHIVIEYAGEHYFLCCPRCQAEFEQDPGRYVRGRGTPAVKSNLTRA